MKKVLGVFGGIVLIVVLLNVIPQTLAVEESVVINAPLDKVYPQVVEYDNFVKWSPWSGLDPKQKTTFSGEPGQVGATFAWESESEEVGVGSMTITAVSENKVDLKLVFTSPWESEANVYYKFEEVEGGTKVSWGFTQEANVMMGFFGIEEMLSEQYNQGLTQLKTLVEKN